MGCLLQVAETGIRRPLGRIISNPICCWWWCCCGCVAPPCWDFPAGCFCCITATVAGAVAVTRPAGVAVPLAVAAVRTIAAGVGVEEVVVTAVPFFN